MSILYASMAYKQMLGYRNHYTQLVAHILWILTRLVHIFNTLCHH